MDVLRTLPQVPLDQKTCSPLTTAEESIPVRLVLNLTQRERTNALASVVSTSPSKPSLSLLSNDFRCGPGPASKEAFRKTLLACLRSGWKNESTEARFVRLVEVLQRDGCAIFAALIDSVSFERLIADFTDIMNASGSHAFLHSFSHLVQHPDFIKNTTYNNAIIHPLLVSLMSYAMGGPIRMTDIRGKDTHPISVNAQDNMLHVDNTPFREEYKILLGWEKGQVKGPTSQNFTFLPGTHKGNRFVRQLSAESLPWSTENDSLFVTQDGIESAFDFQRNITGSRSSTVVEVNYPEQPVTALFYASSLVHHRYRSEQGEPRSCVICAFHLASDHPGALLHEPEKTQPKTLLDALLGYQDGSDLASQIFCELVGSEAAEIEGKVDDLLDESRHSTLVDTEALTLSGDEVKSWRRRVTGAPSATQHKFENSHFLSFDGSRITRALLVDKISSAMAYDKHGLLDLILFQDGHEEIRKPARKSIWTMSKSQITEVVSAWVPTVQGYDFSVSDVQRPAVLQTGANEVASLLLDSFPDVSFDVETSNLEAQRISSAYQLIVDLCESITRCEKVETYITTNLFLFLISQSILPILEVRRQHLAHSYCSMFLRAYISTVLLTEEEYLSNSTC